MTTAEIYSNTTSPLATRSPIQNRREGVQENAGNAVTTTTIVTTRGSLDATSNSLIGS